MAALGRLTVPSPRQIDGTYPFLRGARACTCRQDPKVLSNPSKSVVYNHFQYLSSPSCSVVKDGSEWDLITIFHIRRLVGRTGLEIVLGFDVRVISCVSCFCRDSASTKWASRRSSRIGLRRTGRLQGVQTHRNARRHDPHRRRRDKLPMNPTDPNLQSAKIASVSSHGTRTR